MGLIGPIGNLQKRQRFILSALLFCFSFVFVVGLTFAPRSAQAIPTEVTADVPATVKEVKLTVWQQIWSSALIGLINSVTLFAQTVAYDMAVGLSSGCRGEQACAFVKEPGTYFTAVSYSALGEFLGNLTGPWEELGLNLCNPRLPSVGLAITLGLAEKFQRPKPKCDFLATLNSWDNFVQEATDPHALLKHASLNFEPGMSDIGQAFKAQEQFRLQVARKQRAELTKRLEGGGILPQSGLISGNVTTPAAVMRTKFQDLASKGKEQSEPPKAIDLVKAVGGGQVWAAVGTTVLSTFVNTLASKLLQSFMAGLFGETPNTLPDLAKQIAGGFPAGERPGPPGLSSVASALLTPQIRTSTGSVDYVTELGTCDQNERNRTQLNCAIDQKFMVALQQAQAGRPLTVAQALEQGFLDRGKPFGFTNFPANGPSVEPNASRGEGYPYSGLKKLRLLRVLPLGWEFAALRIKETGKSATLGDVIDGYGGKLGKDKEGDLLGCQGTAEDPAENKFCGLVDPNWVLKAPPATCNALTFSANLDGSGTGRQEECVDWRHCVAEGGPGTDCRAWGYCTREKNTWRFDADTCNKQYASCDTFKPPEGETLNLLENTVNPGVCNGDNAGCTAYATRQNFASQNLGGQATWDSSSARLYLDRDAVKCDARQDGCAELLPAQEVGDVLDRVAADAAGTADVRYPFTVSDKAVYYKLPPDYLGCTGESTDRTECGSYSRYCRREEVGCELYTPKVGHDSAIPAITTALDRCDPVCIGYDTYLKQASRFEPVFDKEDLYPLIPNGTACPGTAVGCDEFTNLRTEQRQYFSDLRACQLPGTDSATYFTWEGSDTTGYQLRTWSFKASNQTYSTDNLALGVDYNTGTARPPCTRYALQIEGGITRVDCEDGLAPQDQAVCDPTVLCDQNSVSFDAARCADCRTFYDGDGNKFNRLMPQTIVSTDECQSFRWTGLPQLPEVPLPTSAVDLNGDGDMADLGEGLTQGDLRIRLERVSCAHGNGYWYPETSQCLYLGAPSFSASCAQTHYGCRGFKGNTGSNMVQVFSEQFASSSVALADRGWKPQPEGATTISFSSESIFPGDQSLKVEGASGADGTQNDEGVRRELTDWEKALAQSAGGATYFAALNVKGTAGRELAVALSDGTREVSTDPTPTPPNPPSGRGGNLSLTPDWKYVEVGPLVPDFIPDRVIFRNPSGAAMTFFVDEVRLRQSRDTVAMVKYSWNIPGVCDTLPAEAGGGYSRGAMLGCREYTDRAGGAHQLKSFSSLCRKDSAGCQDLVDTFGSESPYAETFNTGASAPSPEDNVAVPADRHRYVVVDPANACPKEQKGCLKLAPLDGNTPGAVVYRRNDPNTYNATLCTHEARGCETWTRSDASATYFKRPASDSRCTWKTDIDIGTGTYSGWFRTSKQAVANQNLVNTKEKCEGYGTWNFVTGMCTNAAGTTLNFTPDLDDADNGCGGVACEVNICTKGAYGKWNATTSKCEAEAPCYGKVEAATIGGKPQIRVDLPNSFLIGGTTFGIWRNADSFYGGRAGDCPQNQATCTAFLDPTDKSEGPDGRAYYLKDNARLHAADTGPGACQGQVSRAQGCVALTNSEDPSRPWNAAQSYLASDLQRGALHAPVLGTSADANGDGIADAPGDANTILKVTRDRECAEWFQCASARFVNDQNTGRLKTICDVLGRCNESAATPEEGGTIATCGSWVRQVLLNRSPQVDAQSCTAAGFNWDATANRCTIPAADCTALGGISGADGRCELGDLTVATYLLRDRTFGGQEYTGYSIPNIYGIDQIQEVDLGSENNPLPRLARVTPGLPCTADSDPDLDMCPDTGGVVHYCTTQGQCARALDGSSDWSGLLALEEKMCRGYPERESPFPNTEKVRKSPEFDKVAQCARAGTACECGYKKWEAEGVRTYVPEKEATQARICVGGAHNGKICSEETGAADEAVVKEADCEAETVGGGICKPASKATAVTGWPGYCLETDPSPWRILNADSSQSPCLTWLPIDQLSSATDIYHQQVSASFTAGNAQSIAGSPYGRYYCLLGRAVNYPELLKINQTDSPVSHQVVADDGFLIVKDYPMDQQDIYRADIQQFAVENPYEFNAVIGAAAGTYVIPAGQTTDPQADLAAFDSSKNDQCDVGSHTGSTSCWGYYASLNPDPMDQFAQWWWWVGDDNSRAGLSENEGDNDGRGTGPGSPLTYHLAGLVAAADPAQPQTICSPFDDSFDGVAVLLHFKGPDSDDPGRLDKIRVGVCSGTAGVGYPPWLVLKITAHPHCQYVSKIDPAPGASGSAPNTQMLWSGCTAPGGGACTIDELVPGLFQWSLAPQPWGSSTAFSDNDFALKHPWYLNHNQLEGASGTKTPFAGWPWACQGSTADEHCTVQVNQNDLNIVGESAVPASSDANANTGINRLKKLFAKSHAVYVQPNWPGADDGLSELWQGGQTVSLAKWDVRAELAGSVPQLRAAIGASAPFTESASSAVPLAINGQYAPGAQVLGVNGFLLANTQFFVQADDRQMPIRQIKINWGDGILTGSADGLYKTARAACNSSGFGTSSGACQTDPYRAEHLYSCAGPEDLYWKAGSACPNVDFRALYGGCCVFKPKVQATDNWGFCNGTCAGDGFAGDDDYDGAGDGDKCFETECNTHAGAWSEFAGEVVVAP